MKTTTVTQSIVIGSLAIPLWVAVSIIGCCRAQIVDLPNDSPTYSSYHHPDSNIQIKRVALVPLENIGNVSSDTIRYLERTLADRIRNSGAFEIVQTGTVPNCSANFVRNGQYSIHDLIKIKNQFRADGVLFVSLNNYQAYPPISISATTHLVELSEGKVIKSVDGNWSVTDPAFNDQLKRSAQQQGVDLDLVLTSPRQCFDLVATQIARELAQPAY